MDKQIITRICESIKKDSLCCLLSQDLEMQKLTASCIRQELQYDGFLIIEIDLVSDVQNLPRKQSFSGWCKTFVNVVNRKISLPTDQDQNTRFRSLDGSFKTKIYWDYSDNPFLVFFEILCKTAAYNQKNILIIINSIDSINEEPCNLENDAYLLLDAIHNIYLRQDSNKPYKLTFLLQGFKSPEDNITEPIYTKFLYEFTFTHEDFKSPDQPPPKSPTPPKDNGDKSEIPKNIPFVPIPPKTHKRSFWFWGSLSLILVLIVGISPKIISYFRLIRIEAEQVTIGAVNSEQNYQLLKEYLADKTVPSNFFDYLSGQDVEIVVQAAKSDRPDPYPEGIAKIRNHEWDIAFTYSPVIGLVAEDHGYRFVADMFPGSTAYQASFFVKADSSIEFDKLSSNYTIALGDFFSASKFYMPVYDLYGSSLNVVANVNSKDIFKLVEAGQADLGVGVLGEEVPPEFKVIKKTRDLPGSGVYLSPDLSQNDLRSLEKLLLEAPEDIKKESNYDKGDPPDFQYFRGIVDRVRAVSACSNFEKSPVAFTCGDKVVTTIQGKVNGIEVANVLNKLSIAQDSGSFCNILVKDSTRKKAINYTSIFNLQGRQLRFYVGLPKGQSCSPENSIVIYQPNQIEILN